MKEELDFSNISIIHTKDPVVPEIKVYQKLNKDAHESTFFD